MSTLTPTSITHATMNPALFVLAVTGPQGEESFFLTRTDLERLREQAGAALRVKPNTRRQEALARVTRQREFIQRCGGTLAGYIARYGSLETPGHSGDGGELIYAADMATLSRLEAYVATFTD